MRKYTYLVSLVAALSAGVFAGRAATDEAFAKLDGDVFARIHFAGTTLISADPQAESVNNNFSVSNAVNFREHTLQKLSTAPYRFLKSKISAQNTNDFAALIRPMVEDLLANESYVEVCDATNVVPELMLAVKLPSARAQMWQAYLTTILNSWTGMSVQPIQGDGYSGWELKKHDDPNLIRFIQAGDWVLFGWGQNELRLQPYFLQRIKTSKRPVEPLNNNWLDALVDLPVLNAHHPIPSPLPLPTNLPKIHLSVEGRKDYVRPQMTMLFSKPLDLKLEPWKIPTTYIHNPLASFTAIRGIGPWLAEIPEIKKLNPSSVPNQITFWSMMRAPFSSSAVLPFPGASNYLAKAYPLLLTDLNTELSNHVLTTQAVWTNGRARFMMPYINPYLTSMTEPAGEFVLASLFPMAPKTNAPPLPRDLVREIGSKPNLVCYSWEINSERLMQWQSLNQLRLLSESRSGPTPTGSPGLKWIQEIGTNLSNCGTEILLTAPNELTLVRNAPIGLTGFEMIAIDFWLDAPDFPLNADYPKRLVKPPQKKP